MIGLNFGLHIQGSRGRGGETPEIELITQDDKNFSTQDGKDLITQQL